MEHNYTPTVLTIAGSDPSAGAGIQADLKTIHANGGYAFTVTTALTAQNSQGVIAVNIVDGLVVKSQLDAILSDVHVDAVKIGMLGSLEIVEVVIEAILKYNLKNIVLDTVIISSSGKRLLEVNALKIFKEKLIPLVDIITPNLLEINTLTHSSFLGVQEEQKQMADALFKLPIKSVLIKGGHFNDKRTSTDTLIRNNREAETFSSPRIDTNHTHGTGCILSSAISTHLAKGECLKQSVYLAKAYLTERLKNSSILKLNYNNKNKERTENINHYCKEP